MCALGIERWRLGVRRSLIGYWHCVNVKSVQFF